MLKRLCCALLGVAALAATLNAADARARAISTDGTHPWMTVPAPAGAKVSAMFIYSSTSNADIISLATADGTPILPPLFCTKAIAGTCAASNPGDTKVLGVTGPHGALPAGVFAPFRFDDDGNQIPISGPVNLALTNTGDCGDQSGNCTFVAGAGAEAPGSFENDFILMNLVLPCPDIYFNPGYSESVGNNTLNAEVCGKTKSADPWSTFGFTGAPSLADLVGTGKADFLADKLAAGQLSFIAFQDTIYDTDSDLDKYTYDDAVMAVWFDSVPEPVSIALFGAGVAGAAAMRLRRRKAIPAKS